MDKFIQLSLSIFVSSLLMFGCSSGSDGNNAELPQPRQSTWGVAELIETSDSGNSYQPQIAIDSNGNAIAVWGQNDGTLWNFWANRFDGHSWGTPELIETNDSGDASNPQIAIDSNGNAIAVWGQDDGTLWNIWANRFDGISWGIAELLETNDSENATDPQIAINVEGNAIAVWEQSDNTLWNIMAKRFNGSSWGIVAPINSVDSGETGYAQIAMDGSGKAIAVWHQFDGIRFNIWANRFSGSSWGTAELIETNDTSDMAFPQIACNADGYAMVVWNQYNGYRYDIWANSFDGFSWGTSELVETDDTGNARYPQIAIDNNGNAIAVWSQYVGTRYNIWANHFYDSSWGVAEFIENNDSVGPSVPQIAIDTSGNAIAIWSQFDGSYDSIYTNRYQ